MLLPIVLAIMVFLFFALVGIVAADGNAESQALAVLFSLIGFLLLALALKSTYEKGKTDASVVEVPEPLQYNELRIVQTAEGVDTIYVYNLP